MKTKYNYGEAIVHVIDQTLLGFLAFLFLACCGFLLLCSIFLFLVGMFGWVGAIVAGAVISLSIIALLVKREIKEKGRIYEKH